MNFDTFIPQALAFFFISVIAFFIPGNIFVSNLKTNKVVCITLSYILGISLWGIQGFFFGLIGIRELTYFYLILFNIFWIYQNYRKFKIPKNLPKIKLDKLDYLIIFVIIIGISIQLLSVIWNFIPYQGGLFFNSGIPDNLYHTGVAKELIKSVPPQEPGIYNSTIYNYHYLSNLISAEISRIFKLNIIYVDFHFFPILLTTLFGLAVYSFGRTIDLGKKYIFLLLLIIYFIGDLIPYFHLILKGSFDFSYSTIENPMSMWYSFSRYTGLVLFFGGITALTYFFKTKNKYAAIVFSFILGSIIGFKVYVGLIALIGLFFIGIYYLFKKQYKNTVPLITTAVISLLIYLPVNKGAGGIIYTGFWRFEDFIAQPMWDLSNMELARHVYLDHDNKIKVLLYDVYYASIYIFFSIGFLLIGFFNSKKSLSKFPKELNIFLLSGLTISLILGFFFIQNTGGANSSQFLISIYIIGSIYAALAINRLGKKSNKILIGIVAILFLISSMRVVGQTYLLVNKVYSFQGYKINSGYIDAINYASKNINENSVFLVDPNIGQMCLLVNLIDTKNLYYCDTASPGDKNLINDISERKYQIKDAFYGGDFDYRINHLNSNSITHVIATSGATINFLEKVYENEDYKIMKVNP